MMDEFLRVRTLEQVPSAEDFASQIETKNVPVVINGCVKDWKALSCWNPNDAGLDYLQERVGSVIVEAMLSRSAPIFYGDLRSHERVPLLFSAFIDFCKQHIPNTDDGHDDCYKSERHKLTSSHLDQSCLLSGDSQQIYLAQVPIMNMEDKERVQLKSLIEDIQIPPFLGIKELASINLWMNSAQTRSSTHHDPHHNLLCVVSGCKQVVLWPPSACPSLYPMPIYGEASNHSSVPLENPDFSIYPRAECLMKYSQNVILHAGDALFIPEGWFHQVDSDNLTIAVNFWWQSNLISSMLEHMDAYYLRRIVRRMTDKEMNQLLNGGDSVGVDKLKRHGSVSNNEETDHPGRDCGDRDVVSDEVKQDIVLHELELPASKTLYELTSLVHAQVDFSDQIQPINVKGVCKNIGVANLFHLEDDPVAKIIWTLEPATFRSIFLAMAHNFPRTLEALILHLLSPVGAEVLTQKFEEMDQQTAEDAQKKFYQVFYGAFEDQSAAMDSILNGKESFASQAFNNVLDQYLAVDLKGLKSSV